MILQAVAAALALALLAGPVRADPEVSVRDPDASYFDIAGRRALLARTTDPVILLARDQAVALPSDCQSYAAPSPKPGPYSIPPYYGDRAAWNEAVKPYHDLQLVLTRLAMRYIGAGDDTAAPCMVAVLAEWADAGALIEFRPDADGRRQSWYLTTWTAVSAAMAYSIVRGETSLDPDVRQAVESWLNRVVRNLHSMRTNGSDNRNNHAYWRALAATAGGVVSQDHELFARGIDGYRNAVAALSPDGSWPLEMARGERAIHYQNFALQPLIFLRAFAQRQGVDADLLPAADGAISFLLRAIAAPEEVARHTNSPQDLSFLAPRPTSSPLAALELVAAENPSAMIEEFLRPYRPLVDRRVAAAATLYHYRPAP